MRIVSGSHRGRKIKAPNNLPIRPTTDMSKESIFNILSNLYEFNEISVIDLFHVSCIRRILNFQYAYCIIISNGDVLKAALSIPCSFFLLRDQLKSFGRIVFLDHRNCMRELVFEPDDILPLNEMTFERTQGRPLFD